MTGFEIAVFICGVVVPIAFKIANMVIDRYFPKSKADDITDVMAPFIDALDKVKDTNTETKIDKIIERIDKEIELDGAIAHVEEVHG